MQNEGARMEIMIAALFALVVFQQVQIAHLNTRLINVLENQATTTTLERRTAIRQHGTPRTPTNHFQVRWSIVLGSSQVSPGRGSDIPLFLPLAPPPAETLAVACQFF